MEAARKKKKLWLFLPVSALVVLAGVILGTICMVDYYGAGVLMVFIFSGDGSGGVWRDSFLPSTG